MKKKIFSVTLALVLIFALGSLGASAQNVNAIESQGECWTLLDKEDMPRSYTQINLSNVNITSQGAGVTINDNVVSIYSSGTYSISGVLSDGQIRITAPAGARVHLILHRALITNTAGAAIYTVNETNLHITMSENTRNVLRNSNTSTGAQQAALYARGNTTLGGEGVLVVHSDSNRGISSQKDLNVTSGAIRVISYGNGFFAGRDINIHGGTLVIRTTGESGRGIRSDQTVNIHDGSININAADEGIEAYFVNIYGGYIDIYSVDDGINITYTGGLLTINGGEIIINAQGDGIDSNNAITIGGGKVFVSAFGPCPLGQAIDLEGHNNFRLYGGTIVGTGTIWGNVPRGYTGQPAINLEFNDIFDYDVEVSLRSSTGEIVLEFTSMRHFSALFISIPELIVGETYYVYFDDESVMSVYLNQEIVQLRH